MIDKDFFTAEPSEPVEDINESGSILNDFGRKVFKGDKVIWTVFIILCYFVNRDF